MLESASGHRESYADRAAEKLFIPFDKDGHAQHDVIEASKAIEASCEQYPEFVGITYRGSSARGYSEKSSDIDFHVIYDPSIPKRHDTDRTVSDAINGFRGKQFEGREIHVFRSNVNMSSIRNEQDVILFLNGMALGDIAALFEAGRGPRLREYREKVATLVHSLSADAQATFKKRVVECLVGWEEERMDKMQKRMPSARIHTNQEVENFLNARRALWSERVEHILEQTT